MNRLCDVISPVCLEATTVTPCYTNTTATGREVETPEWLCRSENVTWRGAGVRPEIRQRSPSDMAPLNEHDAVVDAESHSLGSDRLHCTKERHRSPLPGLRSRSVSVRLFWCDCSHNRINKPKRRQSENTVTAVREVS